MSVQGPLHYRGRYGKAIFALTLFSPIPRISTFASVPDTVLASDLFARHFQSFVTATAFTGSGAKGLS